MASFSEKWLKGGGSSNAASNNKNASQDASKIYTETPDGFAQKWLGNIGLGYSIAKERQTYRSGMYSGKTINLSGGIKEPVERDPYLDYDLPGAYSRRDELEGEKSRIRTTANHAKNLSGRSRTGHSSATSSNPRSSNYKPREADPMAIALSKLTSEKVGLQQDIWKAERAQTLDMYESANRNDDYAVKSVPSGTKREAVNLFNPKTWGGGDDKYDFINNIDGYREFARMASLSTGQVDAYGGYQKYAHMTDAEIKAYNYAYAMYGKDEAENYLEALEFRLTKRRAQEKDNAAAKTAEDLPVLSNIASVMTAPAKGMGAVKATIYDMVGKEVNPYDRAFDFARVNNTIRSTTSKNIAESGDGWFAKEALPFAYQTGMSVLDNAFLIATGMPQAAVLAAMGTGAASDTMIEAFDRGATQSQAVGLGVAAGIAEVLFEKISLDSVIKMSQSRTAASLLKNLLKQSGIEASEEVCTEIANIVSDIAIMSEKSSYNVAVQHYMTEGRMTQEQAEKKAFLDLLGQVGLAGLGGALSGGVMGAGATAISNYSMGQDLKRSGAGQGLVDAALTTDQDSKAYKMALEMSAKQQDGTYKAKDNLSGGKLRRLSAANTTAINTQTMAEVNSTLDGSKNAAAISKVFNNVINGNGVSAHDAALIRGDQRASELFSRMFDVKTENLTDSDMITIAQNRGYGAQLTPSVTTPAAGEKTALWGVSTGESGNAGGSGPAAYTVPSENAAREGYTFFTVGEDTSIKTPDGTAVPVANVQFSSPAVEHVYQSAAKLDSPAAANAMVESYKGGDAVAYTKAFSAMYRSAKVGLSYQQAVGASLYAQEYLSESQRAAAYEAGSSTRIANEVRTRQVNAENRARSIQAAQEQGKSNMRQEARDEYKPGVNREYSDQKLSPEQRKQLRVIDEIFKAAGKKIIIHDKIGKQDGQIVYNRSGGNAYYDPKTDTYHLSLDAVGQAYAFVTVHESIHEMRAKNAEGYDLLRDIVTASLEGNLMNRGMAAGEARAEIDRMVKHQADLNGFYTEKGGQRTYSEENLDDAMEEVLANTVPVILTDETQARRFADKVKQAGGEIRAWFEQLLKDLVDILDKAYSALSKEQSWEQMELIRKDKNAIQMIADAYFDGMEGANGTGVTSVNTRNSIEDAGNGKKYVKADRTVITGNDSSKWGVQVENYINKEIRDGKDVVVYAQNGTPLTITSDTAGKAAFRNYVELSDGSKRPMTDEEYAVKLRAELHIDELAQISRGAGRTVIDKKGHVFARDGFNYRIAYFADQTGYYELRISVGKNGRINTVYNVGQIKEADFPTSGLNGPTRSKTETGNSASSDERVSQDNPSVKNSIRESSEKDVKFSLRMQDIQRLAIEQIGTTYSWSETGYVTPDGKQLDFSGKRDGGPAGHRNMDHGEIAFVFSDDVSIDGTDAMIQFMAAGNIRIMPENGGINLSVLPTAAQREKLQAFIRKNNGEVIVDFDDTSGNTLHSVEYPAGTGAVRVTNDIRRYFEEGVKPEVSDVQKYRFSLKDVTPSDTELIQADNEGYSGTDGTIEQQLSMGLSYDEKAVGSVARAILKQYNSAYDLSSLTEDLGRIFSYLSDKNVVYAEARDVGTGLMKKVLAESRSLDASTYEATKPVRDYLRNTGITLSEKQKAEAAAVYDGYGTYHRSLFGKVKLVNDGLPLDSAWRELAEMGWVDANTTEGDQVTGLMELASSVQKTYINEYGYDTDGYAYDMFLQAVYEYMVRKGDNRYVSKLHEQINAIRAEEKAKYQKRISDIRAKSGERYEKKLGEAKAQYRDRLAGYKQKQEDRRQKAKYRKSIEAKAKEMVKSLSSPNLKEGKYVPDALRGPVLHFLQNIDFTGSRGGKVKQTLWYNSIVNLRNEYNRYAAVKRGPEDYDVMQVADDFGIVLDDLSDSVAKAKYREVNQLNATELEELDYIIKNLRSAIRNANRTFRNRRFATAAGLGDSVLEYAGSRAAKEYRYLRMGQAFKDFMNVDMLDSYSFFDQFGEAGKSLSKELDEGMQKSFSRVRQASEFMESLKGEFKISAGDINGWNSEIHEFVLTSGEKVVLSTTQIMDMYNLNLRKQAQQHLLGGGVEISEIKSEKGSKIRQRGTFGLAESDVSNITGALTDQQRGVCDALMRYLSEECSAWGNEVTQERYGVDSYRETRYWPIRSSSSVLKTEDPDAVRAFNALANSSFTKATNKYANNSIRIDDVFQVFSDHVAQMAQYNGLALPIDDLMKWINYQQRNEEGKVIRDANTKNAIERIAGEKAKAYLVNLVKDINGLSSSSYSTALPSKLMSNFKRSAVAGKLRVVIQQPTAIGRALAMIDGKYLIKATLRKHSIKEMQDNAPIAWWKAQGNYEIGVGRSLRSVIVGDDTGMTRLTNAAMAPAGFADDITWSHIWEAVKLEVKDRNPDLSQDAFMAAVVDRFSDIVNRTQVVDSVLHRSQAMRSKDLGVGQATAFMSEPTKSYNMLRSSIMEVVNGKDRKKAGKLLARTTMAWLLSQVLNAVVLALHDTFRDRDEEDEFADMFLEKFVNESLDNINPFGMIPFMKEIVSLVQGYESSTMTMNAFSDLWRAVNGIYDQITGDSKRSLYYTVSSSAKAMSNALGLPFGGIMASLETVVNGIAPGALPDKKPTAKDYSNKIYNASMDGDREKRGKLYDEAVEAAIASINESEQKRIAEGKNPLYSDSASVKAAARRNVETGIANVLKDYPDIATAYEYRKNGYVNKLDAVYRELKSLGFSHNEITYAINYYENAVTAGKTGSKTYKEGNPYTEETFFAAASRAAKSGSYSEFDTVHKAMIKYSGAQDPDASVKSKLMGYIKDETQSGRLSAAQAKNMLIRYGGYSGEDADAKVAAYEFFKDYPEYDGEISQEAIAEYNELCQPAGVTAKTYYSVYTFAGETKADVDSNGKAISGSKKEKVMAYINSLNIPNGQKDALYYACDYAKSTINEAPWH